MRHKNSQKRYYIEDAIYFVTTRTFENRSVFSDEINCKILTKVIFDVSKEYACHLFGFVIIPNHAHILIQPLNTTISKIMNIIKGRSARLINSKQHESFIIASAPSGARPSHRERERSLACKRGHVWLKSFHDHIIRDENDLETHLDYIKFNPIKHGVAAEGEKFPFMHIDELMICEN